MSGAPRNSDKLNTLAIATVGVCASALVYVSIVLLQAYYANDSAQIQNMADYGGQESPALSLKTAQLNNISEYVNKLGTPDNPKSSHQVPIAYAMELVVADAKTKPDNLVPGIDPATKKPTRAPMDGRPKPLGATPAPATGPVPAAVAPGAVAPGAPATPSAPGATATPAAPAAPGTPATPAISTPAAGTAGAPSNVR